MTEILAWHFSTGLLGYGDGRSVIAGKTHKVDITQKPLVLCHYGLHASIRPIDALTFAPRDTTVVARVKLSGKIITSPDKCVASERTYLNVATVTEVLHEFACKCAEQALTSANVTDQLAWNAISVKRLWIAGKATDVELRAAAWAAAAAARDAAAWAAARDNQNIMLEDMLLTLLNI